MELHASHLMLGRQSGALLELDLATRTVIAKVCCASSCLLIALHWHFDPVQGLCSSVSHTLLLSCCSSELPNLLPCWLPGGWVPKHWALPAAVALQR